MSNTNLNKYRLEFADGQGMMVEVTEQKLRAAISCGWLEVEIDEVPYFVNMSHVATIALKP